MENQALVMPRPRWPSTCSIAPMRTVTSGSAPGLTIPSSILRISRANRLMPWVYTPSSEFLAISWATFSAFFSGQPRPANTWQRQAFTSSKGNLTVPILFHSPHK